MPLHQNVLATHTSLSLVIPSNLIEASGGTLLCPLAFMGFMRRLKRSILITDPCRNDSRATRWMFDIEHDFITGGKCGRQVMTRHPRVETQFAVAE
jgi:hypothetical protein